MDWKSTESGNSKEVYLSGRFVFSDNESFRQVIHEMDEAPGRRWVLDLEGLEFIDSAGLGMLLIAREAAQKNQIELFLRGAQGQVSNMLQISKFDTLIPCES